METEVEPKRYFILQEKLFYLLTDRNQTYSVRAACAEMLGVDFSGKSFQRKAEVQPNCLSLFIGRNENYNTCKYSITCELS
jgi:hypothetical protein